MIYSKDPCCWRGQPARPGPSFSCSLMGLSEIAPLFLKSYQHMFAPKSGRISLNLDLPVKLIHYKNRFCFCFSIYATGQGSPSGVLGPFPSLPVASGFCSSLLFIPSLLFLTFPESVNVLPEVQILRPKSRERGGLFFGLHQATSLGLHEGEVSFFLTGH